MAFFAATYEAWAAWLGCAVPALPTFCFFCLACCFHFDLAGFRERKGIVLDGRLSASWKIVYEAYEISQQKGTYLFIGDLNTIRILTLRCQIRITGGFYKVVVLIVGFHSRLQVLGLSFVFLCHLRIIICLMLCINNFCHLSHITRTGCTTQTVYVTMIRN